VVSDSERRNIAIRITIYIKWRDAKMITAISTIAASGISRGRKPRRVMPWSMPVSGGPLRRQQAISGVAETPTRSGEHPTSLPVRPRCRVHRYRHRRYQEPFDAIKSYLH
jgi:hypothetical protein